LAAALAAPVQGLAPSLAGEALLAVGLVRLCRRRRRRRRAPLTRCRWRQRAETCVGSVVLFCRVSCAGVPFRVLVEGGESITHTRSRVALPQCVAGGMAAFVHRNRLVLRNSYRYGQAAPVQCCGGFLDTHGRFAMTIVVGNHSPEAKSEEIITLPESLVNVWLSPKRCARASFTLSYHSPIVVHFPRRILPGILASLIGKV